MINERLLKALKENRESYTIDRNGRVVVKESAILDAIRKFCTK